MSVVAYFERFPLFRDYVLPLIASPTRRRLASGALVEVLPGTPLDVTLHWQFARRTAPALAGLTRALRRAAAGVLLPPAP